MRTESLEDIIAKFNQAYTNTGKPPDQSAVRWISANVLWVRSWALADNCCSHEYYLVCCGAPFGGIVYVMLDETFGIKQKDLHILVTSNMRRRGFICPAMHEFILPHLYNQPICDRICDRRREFWIRASTDPGGKWSEYAEQILKKLNFKPMEDQLNRHVWKFVDELPMLSDYGGAQPFPPLSVVVQNAASALDDASLLLSDIESSFPHIRPEQRADVLDNLESFRICTFEILEKTAEQKVLKTSKAHADFVTLERESQKVLWKLGAVAGQVEIHRFSAATMKLSSLIGLCQHDFWKLEKSLNNLLANIKWEVERGLSE
jgi:hypothetical protein